MDSAVRRRQIGIYSRLDNPQVLEYCPGGSLEDLIVQHQNDQKYFKGQESMKIQKCMKIQEYP